MAPTFKDQDPVDPSFGFTLPDLSYPERTIMFRIIGHETEDALTYLNFTIIDNSDPKKVYLELAGYKVAPLATFDMMYCFEYGGG